MLSLKSSVKFGNHAIAMAFAAITVNDIFKKWSYPCVITSVNDSKHGTGSLHPKDDAFDFRTKHVATSQEKHAIIKEIKEALTADFDIVFENEGLDNEHGHLEFQPK